MAVQDPSCILQHQRKGNLPLMTAIVQHEPVSRLPPRRDPAGGSFSRASRGHFLSAEENGTPSHQWPVDLTALARCRDLLNGHAARDPSLASRLPHEALMDVPAAYDGFCRSHFSSVRRMHPELTWDDARPAYAVALSAHAVLCEALDEQNESQLAVHWDAIRAGSNLSWLQARALVSDGCRALSRLDPLAMHR